MIGPRISNRFSGLLPLLGIALAAADDLTLTDGGSRLSGTLLSITESGVVELASDLAEKPLLLRDGTVQKIVFSVPQRDIPPPGTLIELANGDLLPATIERLDTHQLHVASPYLGALAIPRGVVRSIQTGIRQRQILFKGPENLDGWIITDDARKNLKIENGRITANGPALLSVKPPLPQRFILGFDLIWQDRQNPNFLVSFADPLRPKGEPADRYYLQFGAAGLEIKREASRGKRYSTIAILNRTREQFPDNRMRVELRVNRDTARMELLLNGESEGEFADPIPNTPTGSGVSLVSNASNGVLQYFGGIEVSDFDEAHARHLAEDRGDPSLDSLISREDDRLSGELLEIRPGKPGLVFVFKSQHQDSPMEIPEAEVSTVFLAAGTDREAAASHPFVIRMSGNGALRVISCRMGGEKITASHPLLGPLPILRDGVSSIERVPPPANDAPEP